MLSRRHCLALLAAPLGARPAAAATPVGSALQRPALAVKAPQAVGLLAAAQAGTRLVAVGERGVIALSDDGGASWRQAACPVSVTLTTVRFADAQTGWATGHGGSVLATRDGGSTWAVQFDGLRAAQAALQAAATPEARRDAERLVADGPDKPFLDLLLLGRERLLAVGAFGLAFHSADGGLSWTPWMDRLPNPKALHWYVARRRGDTVLLAGEQGLLARSDDGGQSFRPLATPYKGSWFAGELLADGRAVLAGLRGNVWRGDFGAGAAEGADAWHALPSPVPATVTAMAQAADGRLLLATQAGVLLRLQGDALLPLKAAPVALPAALLPLADGRLLALGASGIAPVKEIPA